VWEFPAEWWEDPWSLGQGLSLTGVLSHTSILQLHFLWRQSIEGAVNTVKLQQNKQFIYKNTVH
jgi:hypothetical protein